jgi:hypothetical protein
MSDAITIRHSTEADRGEIEKLAQLESRRAPDGAALLAFVHGELRAALPLSDGSRPLADPFRRTADLVELLRLRARQDRALRWSLAGLWRRRRASAARRRPLRVAA